MKTLNYLTGSSVVRGIVLSALFTFGMQMRLPAPFAGPGGLGVDLTGSPSGFFDLTNNGTTVTVTDYDIQTPDGTLTPSDSQITSGNDFPAQSFFDVFTDINLPPVDVQIQGDTGPIDGEHWNIYVGPNGSIGEPDESQLPAAWTLPDHSQTWLLLFAGVALLRLTRARPLATVRSK